MKQKNVLGIMAKTYQTEGAGRPRLQRHPALQSSSPSEDFLAPTDCTELPSLQSPLGEILPQQKLPRCLPVSLMLPWLERNTPRTRPIKAKFGKGFRQWKINKDLEGFLDLPNY